jgi:putative DNA primase/helicase
MSVSSNDGPTDRAGKFPTSETTPRGTPAQARRGRRYLFVPYAERDEASELGAKFDFDKKKKAWYVPHGVDDAPFAKWFNPPQSLTEADIRSQFERACEAAGLVLPAVSEKDGWYQTRVTTSRDTKALKGAYRIELGDAPNGYIVNHDTGYSAPWFPEGLVLSSEDRESHRRLMETNRRQREEETAAERQAVSQRASAKWATLPSAVQHPYADRKQVAVFGLRLDGDKLVTPLADVDGKVWSLQYIDAQGNKLYEKGGQKTGHFHVLGDINAGKTVLFGEGYATCASLHMATRLPVVEVFDGGNIGPVMTTLAPHLKGKALIVCGDDDVLTRDRVMRTLNKTAHSDFAKPKLALAGGIADDEVVLDGVARALRANADCTLKLAYELSPEGVQRIVGEFSHKGHRVPVKIANLGREKALAAAIEHEASAIFPVFQSLEGSPTDFNDLQVREGLPIVRRQVGMAMLGRTQPATVERTPEDVAREAIGAGVVVNEAKDNRRYVGNVVGNTPSHAVQNVGKQTAIAHDLARLDRVPVVGTTARIAYSNGRGEVETQDRSRVVSAIQR